MGLPLGGLAYVGLTQTPQPAEGAAPVENPPAPSAGQVIIMSPADGAALDSGTVPVPLKLDPNEKLARRRDVPTNPVTGLVHLHLVLDGGRNDTLRHSSSALFAREGSAGSYSGAVPPKLTYRRIPPGRHVLRVEVVHNDHEPGGAVATASATFEVR